MKEPTLVINRSPAPSVTKNVQHQAIYRHMKEPTLEINHSAALNVATNAQHQVFKYMKEPTLVTLTGGKSSWSESIRLARRAMECQVSETCLTRKICIFFHAFSN